MLAESYFTSQPKLREQIDEGFRDFSKAFDEFTLSKIRANLDSHFKVFLSDVSTYSRLLALFLHVLT